MKVDAPVVRATHPFDGGDPRESMRAHGYAFLRQVLDPSELTALRTTILGYLADAGWLAAGTDPAAARPGEVAHSHDDVDDYRPLYHRIQSTPLFHELGHRPRLLAAIEQILGEPAFSLPLKMARLKYPGSRAERLPTPPHQDYSYIEGSPDTLTAWVPLAPTPEGQGRLAVLAGSHRCGLQVYADGWTAAERYGLEWHASDFELGDVLVFHTLAIHSAEDNPRDEVRITVDYRYQPIADPVAVTSLDPHYQLDTWDGLYRDWADSPLRYYWQNQPLEVVNRSDEFTAQSLQAARTKLGASGTPNDGGDDGRN